VGRAIVDHLVAEGDNGRVPIVGVTGSDGTTLATKLIARLLELNGSYVGSACREGFFLNRRPVQRGDCANWHTARRVLMNRAVQAAVLENSPRAILSEGLAYDRCDVGVVTGIDRMQGVADFYVHETDHLANVMRTQVDLVLDGGAAVLNADDEEVAAMAELCDGDVIFFSRRSDNPAVIAHLGRGKRCVLLRGNDILLVHGASEVPVLRTDGLRYLKLGQPDYSIESVLAAIGAAWALGIEPELIGTGIATYGNEAERLTEKDGEAVWYKRAVKTLIAWCLTPGLQKMLRHGRAEDDLLATVHKD
jgi:cyanophycin synthetase